MSNKHLTSITGIEKARDVLLKFNEWLKVESKT